ncbi:MAG TPA: transglycosylase SLT domain-containing protein [Chitinispirillaceae bacterium]|jgi:membrane-bound lytic murein transglycosylase D|nr:transglycosylase SLT domain-containing protein [Chitinispirillaceae bacterium]
MMKFIPCIYPFLFFSLSFGAAIQDSLFPVPEFLKGNVDFWKKIYTEVSSKEGLLHDRDFPQIIYGRISGSYDSRNVKTFREEIVNSLNNITSHPESTWTDKEKKLFEQFKKHASILDLQGAAERVRFQQGQAERFREGLVRSGMYIDTIRAILTQYGVPLRLAYLPHVESSFNTEAYSKVGAAGLWQFMRGTGRLYGMKIDYSIDERRDPVISTIAAAKYLSSSYKELGTWPLAITSYNHGVYGMKRAVKQTGSTDLAVIIQNYSSRSFKFASSNFYSCFIAASEIAENHASYFPTVALMSPVKYTDITLTHYISSSTLCKYLNISPGTLASLNPAIRPVVFEQHKQLPAGFSIHIPPEISADAAVAALAKIPDSLKSKIPERPRYYKVNKGDNLYAIASRLGVSLHELAYENNITRYNRIRAGQILRVPGHTEKPATKPVEIASAKSRPTEVKSAAEPVVKAAPVVADTEAVIEIARAEVQQILAPEEIPAVKKETVVPIPPPAKVPAPVKSVPEPQEETIPDSLKEAVMTPALAEPESESESDRRQLDRSDFDISIYNLDVVLSSAGTGAEIRVSIEETIGHYAEWLKIPTRRIRKINDMGANSDIRVNSKLLIPIENETDLENFVAARLEYHMAIEEDFYSQYMVSDLKQHTIERGETLWDLCNKGENIIPLWLFKKYNKHIDLNRLVPGMVVQLPIVSENTGEKVKPAGISPAPSQKPFCYNNFRALSPLRLVP